MITPFNYFLAAALLLPLTGWAQTGQVQTDSLPYKIYSVKRKKEIKLDRMVRDLRRADVIFFGEQHGDSVAHTLEMAVLQQLHQRGKGTLALSMEMFQSDMQLILDEYTTSLISERGFERDARLWDNYDDYRPLVDYARENRLYVLAANAPGRYTNRVTHNGLKSLDDLGEPARNLLAPLPVDTLTGAYYEKFSAMMGGHAGMQGMHLYQSQNLWDATMAWRISELAKKQRRGQILHLTGRFHSDEKLGTMAHLARYAPDLDCLNISAFSDDDFDSPEWEKWQHLADFIIITQPADKDTR